MHFTAGQISILKYMIPGLFACLLCTEGSSQCLTKGQCWDQVLAIENSSATTDQKLQHVIQLKDQFDKCGLTKDSVYARILHRIGSLQYKKALFNDAIQNTTAALRINTSGKAGACLPYAAKSYFNLGYCYEALSIYNRALAYYDSSISINVQFQQNEDLIIQARNLRGHIFYKKGDFEKGVEETTLGLQTAEHSGDTAKIIDLLLERSQSYEIQQKLAESLNDVNKSLLLLKGPTNYSLWANACRYKADILADQANCSQALNLYKKAIDFRIKAGGFPATDYNDAGYLLMYKCNDAEKAMKYFDIAYKMGTRANDNTVCALAANNLAQVCFAKRTYTNAVELYQRSLQLMVPHYKLKDLLSNPPYSELSSLQAKNYLWIYLYNKAKCMLQLYRQSNNLLYLKSTIATSLLTDSIITDLIHEQGAEQSKLYWRNDTRDFFALALEACYLDNNPKLAFLFMEKSRAALLNDRLNELGAAVHLQPAEASRQESYQMKMIEEQLKLSSLNESSPEYRLQHIKLLSAKEDFSHYIKSLEQRYPAYYQYKYADSVPSLSVLQQYLAGTKQSFVHYFINDTVTYILGITANDTKFIKLSGGAFDAQQLTRFMQLCSDKEALNMHYDRFLQLANSIYKSLFQPLQLKNGRVIICADNFLIPFEALPADASGKHFLIHDFAFSYVYSARYLMNKFNNYPARGDFLGIAPVSFASQLNLLELKESAVAISASADYYNSVRLLTNEKAGRTNFLKELPGYTVVNIFSHARADTSDKEPMLFMHDAVIYLSELQLINNPATKLVVLSACQTNVGRNAAGEGIYSLARGFASAGIPAVSATLWKADEESIYNISEVFNKNLASGMSKDEALQQAKLSFLETNKSSNNKMLPYYWATMILVGNADPVKLSSAGHHRSWIVAGIILAVAAAFFIFRRRSLSYPKNKRG